MFCCDDCRDATKCPFYEKGAEECVYDALAKAAELTQKNT